MKEPVGLRPFLPRDLETVRDIFAESIAGLAAEDYDEDQLAAWILSGDDEAAFGERVAKAVTLIADQGEEPAGFASLKDNAVIDLLYVLPEHARQGVATALVDALEKIAAARGAKTLTVEASDTAQGFFEKRGYEPQRRNTLMLGSAWLSNTTMTKALAGGARHAAGRA